MYTRRTSLPTVILAALALALGLMALPGAGAAGGVKNVTTRLLVPLDESIYNPATGETVHFSGDVHGIARTKFFAGGTVRVSIQCNATIPGTGDKTGDHYTVKIHDTHEFTFNATAFPFTVTLTCDMRLLNAGSCNDVVAPLTVQFTVQKDGSVSASFVEEDGGDVAH